MFIKIKIDPSFDQDSFLTDLYQNHSTKHKGDSGLDLFSPETITIPPKSKGYLNTGISCEAYNNEKSVNISFWMLSRSSIATKTPLILANSIGLIDAGYRGNLMGVFYNTSDEEFIIEKGQRYLQIAAPLLDGVNFELVDTLNETSRGTGGYGSTGK